MRVAAIRHAIDSPVKRADVTEADANAFVAFLSADGVPDGLLAQMDNMAAMKAADACRVTISMYKAFELMPGDGASRFHAYVLRESLKDAGKTA